MPHNLLSFFPGGIHMHKVTVRDILALPCLEGHHVVAGAAGLDREVASCSVGEILDIRLWLRGKDFIHTTMSFMRDPVSDKVLAEWLMGLMEAGAAALAVKPRRYVEAIPPVLLKLGDRHGFPIIELGPATVQAQVNEEILQLVLDAKSKLLQHGQEALEKLMASALGGGLAAMTDLLAEMVGNPVLLETRDFRFVTSSGFTGGGGSAAMQLRRSSEVVKEIRQKAEDLSWSRSGLAFNIIEHSLHGGAVACKQVTIPVVCSGRQYAYISVLETNHPLEENDYAVLKQACVVAALEVYKETSSAVEEQARQSFLAFLTGPDFNAKQAGRQASFLNFNHHSPLLAVVAHTSVADGEAHPLLKDAVVKQAASALGEFDQDVFVVRGEDELIIFYHLPVKDVDIKSSRLEGLVRRAVEQVERALARPAGKARLSLGVGRAGSGIEHARRSYQEACSALRMAEKFALPGGVFKYTDMGCHAMLDMLLADPDRAALYCKDTLGNLLEPDFKHCEEYLSMLEIYLQCNGNMAEIARRLSLHVNTVKYRLQKIEEFLKGDLNDISCRFSIWSALQARKALGKEKP